MDGASSAAIPFGRSLVFTSNPGESTVFRAVCGLTWLTAATRQQKLLRCGPMQLEEGGGHWAERNQPRQRCNAMSEGRKRHMWGPSARSGPQELNLCCHVVRQCIPCV